MDVNLIYIFLYSALWLFFACFYFNKTRKITLGGVILLVYSFSSLTSIYFYSNTDSFQGVSFSLYSFLFLFFCIFICIKPLVQFSNKISSLELRIKPDVYYFVNLFVLLFFPFIVNIFIESLFLCISADNTNLGAVYEMESSSIIDGLSFLGKKSAFLVGRMVYVWPILFFLYLLNYKKYKVYAFIVLLAFFSDILLGYACAERVRIVRQLMYFVIIYILFIPSLCGKIKKIVNVSMLMLSIIVVLFLTYITVSRYELRENAVADNIFTWISLYTGEGPLRFAQYLPNLDANTNGDTCFSFFKDLLGLDTFDNLDERRFYYQNKLGIPTYIFYTFIGDWYIDLGIFGALIFSIILYWGQMSLYKKITIRKYITLTDLFVLSSLSLIFMFGFMYYAFKTYNTSLDLFCAIVWFVLYNLYIVKKK
jgi:oligosaccharide repeat unit polymerase